MRVSEWETITYEATCKSFRTQTQQKKKEKKNRPNIRCWEHSGWAIGIPFYFILFFFAASYLKKVFQKQKKYSQYDIVLYMLSMWEDWKKNEASFRRNLPVKFLILTYSFVLANVGCRKNKERRKSTEKMRFEVAKKLFHSSPSAGYWFLHVDVI